MTVPGAHVAWGVTVMKDAPHRENAIRFLEMLLGPTGRAALTANGPQPVVPASVRQEDLAKLPESLRPLVRAVAR